MNDPQLQMIREWFATYAGTFSVRGEDLHPFLQMKVDHSQRVAENARLLAEDSGWELKEINAAEALGWLHDVGRFSQFSEFKTFSDAVSINHGERGWEVVTNRGILSSVPLVLRAALLDGIRHHNAKAEPEGLASVNLRFLKLIRDADKLDIFHVVLAAVERDGFQDLPKMMPQIQLNGPSSPTVLYEVQTHRSCSLGHVRSLTDYLLMQLAWIYDLNFAATLRQLAERKVVDQLEQALPQEKQIQEIIHAARRHVEQGMK